MVVSPNIRKAYSEIDEFLELLNEQKKNKMPKKLREFFKEEKDKEYTKDINPRNSIKEQNLKEETLAIIALLNLEYWCENDEEKEILRNIYSKNEQVYKQIFQVSFNPDEVFNKKSTVKVQEQTENQQIILYRESIIAKIIKKIKVLCRRKTHEK